MRLQTDIVDVIYAKEGAEVISADFAERLRDPAASESRTIEALKKAGASEDDIAAAAGGLRLLESLGGLVSFSDAATQAVAKADDTKGTNMGAWTAAEANRAIQYYVAKAEAEKATKPKPAAESVRELEKLEKHVERRHDARAWETIEHRAESIRKSDHSLTKAQSVARVLKQDPELFAAYERHQARQAGYLNDDPSEIHKAADVQETLERAARPFREADPSLTKQQAIAKALTQHPELYEQTH